MEFAVEAALGFSLTYDNAPVTLTQKPRSTFVLRLASIPAPTVSLFSLKAGYPLPLLSVFADLLGPWG